MNARIELCGIPGAGKSTLATVARRTMKDFLGREELVLEGLRRRDFGWIANALARLIPGWRRNFLGLPHGLNDWHRLVVGHPAFAFRLHAWLADVRTDEAWRACVFYALLATAFEFQLTREALRPALLDEGWVQRFFTLRGYRGLGRTGDAALYAETMPRPAGVVWVSTPPATCAERLLRRYALPELLQGESDSALVPRLTEGQALLGELMEEMAARRIPVLKVDGSRDPEAEARRIAKFSGGLAAP